MADEVETAESVVAETISVEPATPVRETAPPIPESTKVALADKIQSSFDKAMGNETDEEVEPEVSADSAIAATDAEPKADEKTETTTEVEAAAPASTLPAAYVRTLKAMEWSDEEIASAGKNPALLPSIAKLHQSRNKELAGWAELGRKNREQRQANASTHPPATPAVLQAFTPKEIEALKSQYGDEAGGLIDTLVGRINPLVEKLQSALPLVEQTQARAQQAQADQINRQITTFFSSKELTPYKDDYGTDANKLTDPQRASRQKVLEFADALIGGASMQGRAMSNEEALQAAHDMVSGGSKDKAARTQVISQLQQRQRAITVKPGARAAAPATGVAKTRGELESRVRKGLASVMG